MYDKPAEFLISLWMAIVSANQVYDFIFILYCHRKNISNLIKFITFYTTSILFLTLVLKPYFKGPRPDEACIHSNGMPSGHSAAAGMNFMFAILLFRKGWMQNKNLCVAFCFLMVNEAYSRIYLYYHTVEQVICGFSFGVICIYLLDYIMPLEQVKTRESIQVEFRNKYKTALSYDIESDSNKKRN